MAVEGGTLQLHDNSFHMEGLVMQQAASLVYLVQVQVHIQQVQVQNPSPNKYGLESNSSMWLDWSTTLLTDSTPSQAS